MGSSNGAGNGGGHIRRSARQGSTISLRGFEDAGTQSNI